MVDADWDSLTDDIDIGVAVVPCSNALCGCDGLPLVLARRGDRVVSIGYTEHGWDPDDVAKGYVELVDTISKLLDAFALSQSATIRQVYEVHKDLLTLPNAAARWIQRCDHDELLRLRLHVFDLPAMGPLMAMLERAHQDVGGRTGRMR